MSTAEFKMETNLAEVTPKSLDFNFEEIKEFLTENLSKYKGLVVTEDQIKDATAIKAKINKVATAIREHRIAIKKEYEAPYLAFKEQCDELEGMCAQVTMAIGQQLNAFEEERKAEKKKALELFFLGANINEGKDFLNFKDVFDSRWLNKTFDKEEAENIILQKISETETAVNAIRNLNSEFVTTLLEEYRRTHDLMGCINKNKELTELKQAEEKRAAERKTKAQQNIENNAKKFVEDVVREAEKEALPKPEMRPLEEVEKVVSVAFRVTCTEHQLGLLKEFLIGNGIKYGKV